MMVEDERVVGGIEDVGDDGDESDEDISFLVRGYGTGVFEVEEVVVDLERSVNSTWKYSRSARS